MNIPGLVMRELINDDGETVTIKETWDLTVPGCPIVIFKPGTRERDTDAIALERTTDMPRNIWKYGHDRG